MLLAVLLLAGALAAAQAPTPVASSRAIFQIVNLKCGLCLSIQGGSSTAGAPLVLWPCQPKPALGTWGNDHFAKITVTSGSTNGGSSLSSAADDRCVDVAGADIINGAPIVMNPGELGCTRQWDTYGRGGAIKSRLSGKCIDVAGEAIQAGAAVVQWDCDGRASQQWELQMV